MKTYRKENKNSISESKKIYNEKNKERIKAHTKEYRKKNQIRIMKQTIRYSKENKDEVKRRTKLWKIKNREKVNQYERERREKIKQMPHTLTDCEWEQLKRDFEYKCAYCGESNDLTKDHFIPVSKGGFFTKENIIPACMPCNSSKGTKDFFEWYPHYECYSTERELKLLEYRKNVVDKKDKVTYFESESKSIRERCLSV